MPGSFSPAQAAPGAPGPERRGTRARGPGRPPAARVTSMSGKGVGLLQALLSPAAAKFLPKHDDGGAPAGGDAPLAPAPVGAGTAAPPLPAATAHKSQQGQRAGGRRGSAVGLRVSLQSPPASRPARSPAFLARPKTSGGPGAGRTTSPQGRGVSVSPLRSSVAFEAAARPQTRGGRASPLREAAREQRAAPDARPQTRSAVGAVGAGEKRFSPTRSRFSPTSARPPPPPSRTKWTRLVHPSVLTGHVSSLSRSARPAGVAPAAGAGARPLGLRCPPPLPTVAPTDVPTVHSLQTPSPPHRSSPRLSLHVIIL